MIFAIITTIIGIIAAITGITLIIRCNMGESYAKDRIWVTVVLTTIFGILSFLFLAIGIFDPHLNLKYQYVPPTAIIKTNNITLVTYIEKDVLINKTYSSAQAWNSTNIMIQITQGENLWQVKLNTKFYDVAIQ